MATMVVPLRPEPAGSEDLKILLFDGEFAQSNVVGTNTLNHTRAIPAKQNRGFGFHPIVGDTDAITIP